MARGKAYTSAKMHCSTSALHERLIREKLSLADFMDERMTSMPGGVPMFDENGVLIAGIGVSGRSPEEDEALALRVRDALLDCLPPTDKVFFYRIDSPESERGIYLSYKKSGGLTQIQRDFIEFMKRAKLPRESAKTADE